MEEIKNDDSRAKLIKVATKLFAEKGLEGTSTRDIAGAADLNVSLISYYFGGKEGLYLTVIKEFADGMQERSKMLLSRVDMEKMTRESFLQTMSHFIREMLHRKLSEPDMGRLLQREVMGGLPHAREIFEKTMTKIPEVIVSIYEAAQKKGIVKKDIHPYVLFFSLVHSTDMYNNMSKCRPADIEDKILKIPEQMDEYIEQIIKIFVEGVLV